MKMNEILQLWKKIDHYYPREHKGDMIEKFESWEAILLKQDTESVFKNLTTHVENSPYPPKLSELINKPERPQTIPSISQTSERLNQIKVSEISQEEIIKLTPRMQRILEREGEDNE